MKRTWMKVWRRQTVLWFAVEGDAIVTCECHGASLHLRADDTLSAWARDGWTIEGPFDAPE